MLRLIEAMSEDSEHQEGGIVVHEGRSHLDKPPRFAVVLLNDHYTTMEFVVEVLKRYFQKQGEDAVRIMMKVHQQGKGIAGVYDHEIAETKVSQVHDYAQSNGFPLRCVAEPIA